MGTDLLHWGQLAPMGHQLYAFKGQGVDLEVEGVRYNNYRDASRAAYMLGPPPSRAEISN